MIGSLNVLIKKIMKQTNIDAKKKQKFLYISEKKFNTKNAKSFYFSVANNSNYSTVILK